ncbi:MAG: DUF4179 domain-containing protein [Eubacterium sp.]|nr:DUF4179 domain-containing protein [Eubacterium sp.]
MKYNLSDILENSNAEETEEFIDNIKINYNETIAQKIKKRVIDGESEQSNKQSKVKHFSLKTMIAFAAVVAIILCSITAGAAIHFKMGNTFSRVFNGKNIDLNSIAADVNVASEYNGYKFEITQVICDGRTMYCAFNCPSENGEMLVPDNGDVNLTINGKRPNSYSCGFYTFNRICYLKFTNCDEAHIKSNSKIHLDFNKIDNNRVLNREDVAEKLLETGKATQAEVDEALNNSENDLAIYELADARLDNTSVSVDGEWSFEFEVGNTNVIRTIDADKVYPYDENNYIEISPLGAYVFSFNPYTMPPIDFEHIFYIEMKDGTVYTEKDTVEVENGYHDGVSTSGYSDWETNEHRTFTHFALAEFINPDEVKLVSFYDKVLYQE